MWAVIIPYVCYNMSHYGQARTGQGYPLSMYSLRLAVPNLTVRRSLATVPIIMQCFKAMPLCIGHRSMFKGLLSITDGGISAPYAVPCLNKATAVSGSIAVMTVITNTERVCSPYHHPFPLTHVYGES